MMLLPPYPHPAKRRSLEPQTRVKLTVLRQVGGKHLLQGCQGVTCDSPVAGWPLAAPAVGQPRGFRSALLTAAADTPSPRASSDWFA